MAGGNDVKQVLEDPTKASDTISDSELTVGWTLEQLMNTNAKFRDALGASKVVEVSAYDISEGKGYLSTVYKTTVKFFDSDQKPYSFVMKVPTLKNMKFVLDGLSDESARQEQDKKMREAVVKAHNVECDFYTRFSGVDGLPIPEVWYTRKLNEDLSLPGVIMMEDLSDVAHTGGMVASINLVQDGTARFMLAFQVKNVACHLAAFHKHQLCLASDELKDLSGVDMHTNGDMTRMFPALSADFVKFDPERLKPLVDKLIPLVDRNFAEYALLRRHKELGLPTVLCHGDLWTNNMLFYKNSDGSGSNRVAAFIDWQVVFHGNPMFDIARYLAMCADAEVRREAEQFIVPFYYAELLRLFEEAGKTPPEGLSEEKLTEAFKFSLIQQSIESIFIAPFMEKTKKASGMDEKQIEAEIGKLVLRTRLLLEDAMELAKEVAPEYLQPEN